MASKTPSQIYFRGWRVWFDRRVLRLPWWRRATFATCYQCGNWLRGSLRCHRCHPAEAREYEQHMTKGL